MPVERKQRLEALGFEWNKFASDWEEGFVALKRFKAKGGHCRVPQRHIEGTYKLGQWAGIQRKKKDNMAPERRQRLEALGFEWDSLASAWEEGFAALQRFKATEGHCRAAKGHLEGTCRLGQWVRVQRNARGGMPAKRRLRLESLSFEWDPQATAWEEGFAALKQFKAREGHCRVPASHIEGAYRLGQWVAVQRSQRKGMPVDRRERLQGLGFEWNRFTSAWEKGFAALERFKAREGHCRVPVSHIEGAYRLGQWARVQRSRRDSTPDERRQRLDALGFVWRAA
jgi:hypothetical protein